MMRLATITLISSAMFGLVLFASNQPPTGDAYAADGYTPSFTANNELMLPPNQVWREWIFVGTPLTPNALNGGEAPFPEFHSVYIEPKAWAHYQRTGEFMEGTLIAKELARVRAPDGANPDGSTNEVSGTGYFMGEFSGFRDRLQKPRAVPRRAGQLGLLHLRAPRAALCRIGGHATGRKLQRLPRSRGGRRLRVHAVLPGVACRQAVIVIGRAASILRGGPWRVRLVAYR